MGRLATDTPAGVYNSGNALFFLYFRAVYTDLPIWGPHGDPMGTPRDPMGTPWGPHGVPMGGFWIGPGGTFLAYLG